MKAFFWRSPVIEHNWINWPYYQGNEKANKPLMYYSFQRSEVNVITEHLKAGEDSRTLLRYCLVGMSVIPLSDAP